MTMQRSNGGALQGVVQQAGGFSQTLIAGFFVLGAMAAQAEWGVADGSAVNYVSIKNNAIAENNRFTSVSGTIGDDGAVQIRIDLSSVETRVDIRNQRMRDIFFEVANHPEAQINAQLEIADLAQIEAGAPLEKSLPLTINLHGSEATVEARLRAVATGGQLYVSTLEPILVSAADFGLDPGVEALRTIAGLNAIASTVPVTVDLRLVKD